MCSKALASLSVDGVTFPQQTILRRKKKAPMSGDWRSVIAINATLGGICLQMPSREPSLQPGSAKGPLLSAVGKARTASLDSIW